MFIEKMDGWKIGSMATSDLLDPSKRLLTDGKLTLLCEVGDLVQFVL